MKKLSSKLRSVLRAAFGLFSLTSVAFVMQACYGSPQDVGLAVRFSGEVTDRVTNKPIPGIRVSTDFGAYAVSDSSGYVTMFLPEDELLDSVRIYCDDIDGEANGHYRQLSKSFAYDELGGVVSLAMDRVQQ